MKGSPPHSKIVFSATFVKIFGEKSGVFIILNHLFPPEIRKIHISEDFTSQPPPLVRPPPSFLEIFSNFGTFLKDLHRNYLT